MYIFCKAHLTLGCPGSCCVAALCVTEHHCCSKVPSVCLLTSPVLVPLLHPRVLGGQQGWDSEEVYT